MFFNVKIILVNRTTEKYLPEFVYGAIDGLVTTFAIVSGVMGASLSAGIILILGFANVLADGFSMGASNYLSKRSENDLEEKPEGQRDDPLKTGLATFISFVLVGLIPLMPFVAGYFLGIDNLTLFKYSIIFTGLLFIVIGLFRGIITKKSPSKSALETLAIGTVASIISYIVGVVLKGIVE